MKLYLNDLVFRNLETDFLISKLLYPILTNCVLEENKFCMYLLCINLCLTVIKMIYFLFLMKDNIMSYTTQ